MPHNSDNIIFFLDTPRAAGGLNHRYFVASPANNDELKITHYATLARENLTGKDYIAACRPAAQVSRGQEREGLELLVLARISTADATRTARLQGLLVTMLNSMQDAPMPVEQSPKGLLLFSSRLADMEKELRAELNQDVSESSESLVSNVKATEYNKEANWWGLPSLRRVIIFIIACVTLGGFLIEIWQMSHRQHESSSANKSNAGIDLRASSQSENLLRKEWLFLENDPIWINLGRVTGLPDKWDVTIATSWAIKLLQEADPLAGITNEIIRPTNIQNNSKIGLLYNSVEHVVKSGSQVDATNVSMEWLRLSDNDAAKLKKLLHDLNSSGAEQINICALKFILLGWAQAVIAFVDNSTGVAEALQTEAARNADSLRKLIGDQSRVFSVLSNADFQRLEFVMAFFNCDEFSKAVAKSDYGKDWQSREWPERIIQLRRMSKDGNLDPSVQRLVSRLADAMGTFHGN